jgi:hypothetical protein
VLSFIEGKGGREREREREFNYTGTYSLYQGGTMFQACNEYLLFTINNERKSGNFIPILEEYL